MELGCPARYAQRSVAELAEHLEDLTEARIEDGLEAPDARAQATEQLGDPAAIAERLVNSFRQASWWGRHPVIGFCLLPPLALMILLPATVLSLYGLFLLGNLFSRHSIPLDEFKSAIEIAPAAFAEWSNPLLYFIHSVPIALNTIVFCKLVARSASGLKWLVVTCAVCSAAGFFTWTGFSQSGFYLGYGSPSFHNWISAVAPLLIGGCILVWRKRRLAVISAPDLEGEESMTETELNLQPASRKSVKKVKEPRALLKEEWFTPTSAVTAAIAVISVLLIKFVFTHDHADHATMENLRNRVWPAERKQVLDLLQIRQSVKETRDEIPISLQPFATAALSDPVCWFGKTNFATLADLPLGLHIFAGVPFAISERVQLMGNGYRNLGMAFPSVIKGIPIGHKCQSLYLLHGASFLRTQAPAIPDENGFMPVLPTYETTNLPIARLVLHYADGARSELEIVSKQHLLDVWGPVCTTKVPVVERCPVSPETELAWIKAEAPPEKAEKLNSVRIYRTRFENPRPDEQILTIDYVSTRTEAAPFLLGLTIE
jgi:hypothetical protein